MYNTEKFFTDPSSETRAPRPNEEATQTIPHKEEDTVQKKRREERIYSGGGG